MLYYDGQFDDARLAMSLMRTLFDLGGTAVNYVRATGLTMTNGKVDGVTATDALGDAVFTLRARCVINATGVWVDAVRRMEDKNAPTMVAPSQGVHLTLPRDFLPGKRAILIPKTDDGRVLFVVPWNGHTIVGTTDTPRDDLPLDPDAGAHDVDFILGTAARYLSRKPTRDDVTSVWAGLRPLVKATGEASTKTLSREHTILVSKAGLVTVTGGKWTTYRRMAQDVVNTAIQNQLLTQALPHRVAGPARRRRTVAVAGTRRHAGQLLRQRPARAQGLPPSACWSAPAACPKPMCATPPATSWRAPPRTCWRVATAPCSWTARPPCWQRRKSPVSWPRNSATTPPGSSARCATWNRWRRAIACAEARDFMRRQPPALYASAASARRWRYRRACRGPRRRQDGRRRPGAAHSRR